MEHVLRTIALSAVPILMAITFHEVAHGYVAYRLGDGTAKAMGRLTLNPIAHIDLIGTIIMPFLLIMLNAPVFGYAKPVPINPNNFRNPRKGMAISAAAGPVTNLLLAIASVLVLRFIVVPLAGQVSAQTTVSVLNPLVGMLKGSVMINVALAAFNLIPIPPLDGGRVLVGLLPPRQAYSYSKIEPFGFLIIILLVMSPLSSYIVVPLMNVFYSIVGIFYGGM
jgi:Zn-dependent protease